MADNDEKPPQTAKEYYERGEQRYDKGDYDGAWEDFNNAIGCDLKYFRAWNGRGAASNAKGKYDKAISDFDGAIRLKPDYAEAWNNRGNAWREKGEYDKAISDYNEAIRLNPDSPNAWTNRGNAWLKKGEYDKAIDNYDVALRLQPGFPIAFQNRESALALQTTGPEREKLAERLKREYEEKLEQELKTAVGQITADTKDFRQSYKKHKNLSEILRGVAIALLIAIGVALPVILWIIYCNEKDSLGAWRLMPWIPVVAAISSPFFLLWWMLQRWSFEALTLAYGFQRKAIVEERIFRFAGDDAKLRKELLKIYVVHWMEKSPLEVMLTIGGKKGMGGGTSPTAALLGKMADKTGDVIDKASKGDGA